MICVYAPDSTDFSGNGLGPVSPLSCTVTETLNGEWELTLEHPLDDDGQVAAARRGLHPARARARRHDARHHHDHAGHA